MKKSWWMRFSLLLLFTFLSALAMVPTFTGMKEDSAFPVKAKVNLGLDLQGGLYMIMGIDFKKVYKDEVVGTVRKIQFILKEAGIDSQLGSLDDGNGDDPRHSVVLASAADVDKAKAKVHESFPGLIRLTGEKGA